MHAIGRHVIAALFTATLTLGYGGSADAASTQSVIVVLRDGADARGTAAAHAAAHGAHVAHVYTAAISGYAARVSAAALAAIARDPRVAFINEDRPMYAFDTHAGELPYGVDRIEGEKSTRALNTSDLTAPGVAVLDTGIQTNHPDLNVDGGRNCSTGRSFSDGNGHGTHVAGTIGARRNGSGVVGMLPGASLYAVRVLDNRGSGSWSSVICGVDWVTANAASRGIKVANMSLGGSGSDDGLSCANTTDSLKKAICNSVAAGVTYVVAAGNSTADLSGFVPAAYDMVLTVTAMADFNGQPGGGAAATCRSDVDDTAADFSNFTTKGHADESHTIAAPGVCIKSTWINSGYNTISGTSMAAPHAAGTVAVCITNTTSAGCSALTPAQIIQKMRSDAALQPASYGFAEDAHNVTATGSRYYGHLIFAGGY